MIKVEDAANLFTDIIYHRIYKGFYHEMESKFLVEGMPGRADDQARLSDWYNSLDQQSKNSVKEIVQLTIKETMWRFLDFLDSRGGTAIKGQWADFAVYLQVYESMESMANNQPSNSARINMLFGGDYEELGNLFLSRID